VIRLGGNESHVRLNTRMQSDSGEGHRLLDGLLFDVEHCSGKVRKVKPKLQIIKLCTRGIRRGFVFIPLPSGIPGGRRFVKSLIYAQVHANADLYQANS
jgi:hypothetical protein